MRCFRRLWICFGFVPLDLENHQSQHQHGVRGHEDQEKIVEIRNLRHVVGRRILKPQLPGLGLGGQRVSGKKPKTERPRPNWAKHCRKEFIRFLPRIGAIDSFWHLWMNYIPKKLPDNTVSLMSATLCP